MKKRVQVNCKWGKWQLLPQINKDAMYAALVLTGTNREHIKSTFNIGLFKYKEGKFPNAKLQLFIGIDDYHDYSRATNIINGFKIYSGLRYLDEELENTLGINPENTYIQLGCGRGVYIHYDETFISEEMLIMLIELLSRVYLRLPSNTITLNINKPIGEPKSVKLTDIVPEVLC